MFLLSRGLQQEALTWEIILELNLTVWIKKTSTYGVPFLQINVIENTGEI